MGRSDQRPEAVWVGLGDTERDWELQLFRHVDPVVVNRSLARVLRRQRRGESITIGQSVEVENLLMVENIAK